VIALAGALVYEPALPLECPAGTEILREYFDSGELSSEQCSYNDGTWQGPFIRLYRSGAVFGAGDYLNGRPTGPISYWSPEGQRTVTRVYERGELVDVFRGSRPYQLACPLDAKANQLTVGATGMIIVDRPRRAALERWCETQLSHALLRSGPSIEIDGDGFLLSWHDHQVVHSPKDGWSSRRREICGSSSNPCSDWKRLAAHLREGTRPK
jgi:hypothetical protein